MDEHWRNVGAFHLGGREMADHDQEYEEERRKVQEWLEREIAKTESELKRANQVDALLAPITATKR